MKILHLCWGLEPNNGAANIARMIMGEQIAAGHEARIASKYSREELEGCDELWCHCGWYWRIWLAVWRAKRMGKRVKWMPECCYDPLRRAYHGWKKTLVGPFERWALRRVDAIVATCEEEGEWCREYVGKKCPPIEISDIKRFFKLDASAGLASSSSGASAEYSASLARTLHDQPPHPLHVLYLGRPHPLKGVKYLEEAVADVNYYAMTYLPNCPKDGVVELHIVSNKSGAELEAEWEWCDVMCLPTLSDNFGLVVAEALERGKSVITTDGAPAWAPEESKRGVEVEEWRERLFYIKGYRDGSDETRVKLLRDAIKYFV